MRAAAAEAGGSPLAGEGPDALVGSARDDTLATEGRFFLMLLTLATSSLRHLADDVGPASAMDIPAFVRDELELRGLNVDASMLAGWSLEQLDELRDRADKAECPCLVLIERRPLALAHHAERDRRDARDRLQRLGAAAHRLGCNAVAIRCEGDDDDESFEFAATEIRSAMPALERLELNVLLAPAPGLTDDPDRLISLIKRIGGFRIGSLPDFDHAARTGDVEQALRKLAPYAGAIHASVRAFTKKGLHEGYDLATCIDAIRKVGFENTIGIEYVGNDDPLPAIIEARQQLQAAIDDDG